MTEHRSIAQTKAVSAIDEGLRQYMLKVYNYMTVGLCITALAAYVTMKTSLLNLFFTAQNGYYTMTGLGWVILFAPLALIFAFSWVINRGTLNQVKGAFIAFSAVMGMSITPVLLAYTGASVTNIFLITAATFGAMSIYGYTTKKSLTSMGSFMMMGLWGLIIASLVNIFLSSSGLSFAISCISVVVFTGLTAYDTQKIRDMYFVHDGDDTHTRKAIAGALALYMDFINLFLALLRLFGDRR